MKFNDLNVLKGKGLGTKMYFPTINNIVDKEYLSENLEGLYVSKCFIDDEVFTGMTNIILKDEKYYLETHIYQNSIGIVSKLSIELKNKLRNKTEVKSDLDEVKKLISSDIKLFLENVKLCSNCEYFVEEDYGYSNYTVEGTNYYCLLNNNGLKTCFKNKMSAESCIHFKKGDHWYIDVDGERDRPSQDYIKTVIRSEKINLLKSINL